ncbi:MAG: site-specific integrase [Rikenellaceae bacterium]|nr:site-specific integrase [Rikenellaceae bacterium]
MATFKFHLRISVRNEEKPGSIFIRFIHRRKSGVVTTPYRLFSREWDANREQIRIVSDDTAREAELLEIKRALNSDKLYLTECLKKMEKQGPFSVEDIVNCYKRKNSDKMLSEYTDRVRRNIEALGRYRTSRAYRTAADALIRFNNGHNIKLDHINSVLIGKFEEDMKLKGKSLNTISFYMRNLRSIYNRAVKEQLIDSPAENPFLYVYTGVQVTKKRALTKQEIVKLNELDENLLGLGNKSGELKCGLSSKGLKDALALFLFSFHTRGMSFVDMAYLRKDNIRNGILTYYRKKTGQMIEMKLNSYMKNLIEYFKRETEGSPYIFPIIKPGRGNERIQYESGLRLQNIRLKTLSKLAGINRVVTTHVARHSWATIAKQENLPLWIISEGLGHANEKTTYIYLKSFERSVLDKANERICSVIHRGK